MGSVLGSGELEQAARDRATARIMRTRGRKRFIEFSLRGGRGCGKRVQVVKTLL